MIPNYIFYLMAVIPILATGCSEPKFTGLPPRPEIEIPATQVRTALETFRNRTGPYPESLQSLVPDDMESIPIPNWGSKEWYYQRTSSSSYILSVQYQTGYYEGYYYSSTSKEWSYDA